MVFKVMRNRPFLKSLSDFIAVAKNSVFMAFQSISRLWGSLFKGRKGLHHSMEGSVALIFITGQPQKKSLVRKVSSLPGTASLIRGLDVSSAERHGGVAREVEEFSFGL
jgi:hypothetical protein